MTNVMSNATCFKNSQNPSLIDVIITDKPNRIRSTLNVNTGISDFHHLIGVATKMHVPKHNQSVDHIAASKI